jgi:hypothetical protein
MADDGGTGFDMCRLNAAAIDPGWSRCFSCGQPMLPWWNTELPVPHGDDPCRQWHEDCYQRWLGYAIGWRNYGTWLAWHSLGWRNYQEWIGHIDRAFATEKV